MPPRHRLGDDDPANVEQEAFQRLPLTAADAHMVAFSDENLDEELDVAGSSAAAESVDVISQCQRFVTGSLADVSGLESVKTELRQAVLWVEG